MTDSQDKNWTLKDLLVNIPPRGPVSFEEWSAANYRIAVLEQTLLNEREAHDRCRARVKQLEDFLSAYQNW